MKRFSCFLLALLLSAGLLSFPAAAFEGDRYHITTARELYELCDAEAVSEAVVYLLDDITLDEVLIVPRSIELVQCTGTLRIEAPLIISTGACLRVLKGASALLTSDASLHNDGSLLLSGTLTVDGLYTGEGKLHGTGRLSGKNSAALKLSSTKSPELRFEGMATVLSPVGYKELTLAAGAGGKVWYSFDAGDKLFTFGAAPRSEGGYRFERWVLTDASGKTLVASELLNKALFSDEASGILWLYASDISAYCSQKGLDGLRFTARFTASKLDTPARTLRFDPGKGRTAASGSMDEIALASGSYRPTKLPDCGFTRANATFIRWNTKPDGTGRDYAPGEYIYLWADTTLYAQWKALPTL